MNPLLAKITGRIQEDDVVPVPAGAVTRRTYRDRLTQQRQLRRGPEDEKDADALRRVVGEAQEGIIPDNAEELDDVGISTLPKTLKPIKDVVQEPTYPTADREKLMTPYSALTAPDATPDALTPIDPSKVPGTTAQTFTAAELEKAEEKPEEEEVEGPGVDKATRTMDLLLGRSRAAKPAADRAEAEKMGAITTEAAARAALKIDPPGMAETIGAAMVPGMPMPPPTTGDAKVICEAFRRFMG